MPTLSVKVEALFLDYFDEWTGGDEPDLVRAWEHEATETIDVDLPDAGCTVGELKKLIIQKAAGKEWADYGLREVFLDGKGLADSEIVQAGKNYVMEVRGGDGVGEPDSD